MPGARSARVAAALVLAGSVAACGGRSPDRSAVYTPARPTFGAAVRDFFNVRPAARQPLPFPHNTHLAKQAMCTDCHETVERGPVAGIPSVKTCMICHSQIAADRPLIKQVASYSERGIEIPWERVYGFTHQAHVRFNHAPHVRANIECRSCHGDLGQMTVARRAVDHTMGFCVNCHREKNASNDCLTCHF
jgi:hypothetical protein